MFESQKKFFEAAKAGDYETVQHYLTKYYGGGNKIDLDARDAEGITALSHAARKGHTKILKRMMVYNVDMNLADNLGHTPLLAALLDKQRESALALLENYANVNAHGVDGIQPIHAAAHLGDLDIVKMLKNNGAELDLTIVANGYTALHWAVIQGHANIVEFLVQAGARADIPDKTGKTSFALAQAKGAHMAKIFEAKPAEKAIPAATAGASPDGDQWLKSGAKRLTHISEHPEISRRLSEIFNFETRERTLFSENLKTGTETVGNPESFDTVAEEALKKALAEFRRLGGEAEDGHVFGKRGAKNQPFRP